MRKNNFPPTFFLVFNWDSCNEREINKTKTNKNLLLCEPEKHPQKIK